MANFRRETRQSIAVTVTSYVRNELLCFVFDRFSANTYNDLKITVTNFYGSEAVNNAKELLWQNYSSHLWSYPRHKGKKTKERNINDIIEAIKIIDQKFSTGSLPVEFFALRLVNLPNFKVNHVLDRIQRIEDMMQELPTRTEMQNAQVLNMRPTVTSVGLQITPPDTNDVIDQFSNGVNVGQDGDAGQENVSHNVDTMVSSSSLDEDDMSCEATLEPSVIPETQIEHLSPGVSNCQNGSTPTPATPVQVSSGGLLRLDLKTSADSISLSPIERSSSGEHSPLLISQQLSSSVNLPTSGNWPQRENTPKNDNGVFQEVRKKRRRKSMVIGTNKDINIASNRKHHVFITHVRAEVDDECVKRFINKKTFVSSCELIKVGKEDLKNKSFHAIIETNHIKRVLTPEFWPSGIAVRRFYCKDI